MVPKGPAKFKHALNTLLLVFSRVLCVFRTFSGLCFVFVAEFGAQCGCIMNKLPIMLKLQQINKKVTFALTWRCPTAAKTRAGQSQPSSGPQIPLNN